MTPSELLQILTDEHLLNVLVCILTALARFFDLFDRDNHRHRERRG